MDETCVSYLWLRKKWPQDEKSYHNIYYLMVPVDQESRPWLTWALCFRIPHRLQPMCQPGLWSSPGLADRAGSIPKFTHVVICRMKFLEGCWAEGPSFLLFVGWRLPQFLVMEASLQGSSQHGSWLHWRRQARRCRERKRVWARRKSEKIFVTRDG